MQGHERKVRFDQWPRRVSALAEPLERGPADRGRKGKTTVCYDTELGVTAAGVTFESLLIKGRRSQVRGSEQDLVTHRRKGVKSLHSEAAQQKYKAAATSPLHARRRQREDEPDFRS